MARSALNIDIEKPSESLVYKRGYSRFFHHILITGDLLFLNLAFLLSYLIRFRQNPLVELQTHFGSLLLVCNLAWIVNVYLLNIYAVSRVIRWETIIWNIAKAIVVHSLIISFFVLTVKGSYYSRLFFGAFYLTFSLLMFSWRILFVQLVKVYRWHGNNFRNVVIIGSNQASQMIYKYFLSEKEHGFRLKAVFGDDIEAEPMGTDTSFFSESLLFDYLDNEKIDEIYCALPLTSYVRIREIMSFAENNLIRFRYVPDFRALLYKKVDIDFYGIIPVLSVRNEPLENVIHQITKRTFDMVFSTLALLVLVPLVFPIIALCIKASSKGPVFFKQPRSGRDNKVFNCYKFRTMHLNETSDSQQATKSDPRVTQIGKFLRKTSLDELPQFFNVWKGEMSVVGPRPHMLKHTEEYKEAVDKFMIRHFVKPGITGWAQVNGLRGGIETPQRIIKRARYDVWYIENWSLFLDIKIVFMTVFNILKGEKNAF